VYRKSRYSGGVGEEGGGGVILAIKIWKFRGVGGGAYVKFPLWGSTLIFWKAHILDTLRNRPFVRGLSS